MNQRLPDPSGSRAVLIGVSKYRYLSSFPSVVNNLDTLHELLTSASTWRLPEANCVKVLNPPSASVVLKRVHDAARLAESALLIYFAGHGLLDDTGELHLALTNSAPDRMHDAVGFGAIRREVVQTAARCQAKVVLIDSCYSGAAMAGFMGASVADLAVTDGAYIMTASGERVAARAPEGAQYTAFTGAMVKAVRGGVPGGPAMLDMDTLYDQVMLDLRAQNLPLPQRRSRNDGHRIVLGPNRAVNQPAAAPKKPKKKKASTAAPTASPAPAVKAAAAQAVKGAAAQAVKGAAAQAVKGAAAQAAAAQAAAMPAPGAPVKAPPAPQPRRRASARATRRHIDQARRVIRAALREQPLLPVETAASLLIKEVPMIFESSWAGAGTCKLFLAKYLADFPYTQNRTGGFIEAPPPFPRNVLGMLRRRLTWKRLRRLAVAAAVLASLGYATPKVMALVDRQSLVDPNLTVTAPAEGSLTKDRYTVRVSKAAPTGQQTIAMVREASGRWSYYKCAGTQCANVPIGKKGSGKRMQMALVVVTDARARTLLASASDSGFSADPAALDPVATSRIFEYQR